MSERYEGKVFTRHVLSCGQCPDYRRKRRYCAEALRDVPPDGQYPVPEWCPLATEVPWLDKLEQARLRARAEKAEAEVERLREAQRWIPVTERLPQVDEDVDFVAANTQDSSPRLYMGWRDDTGWRVAHMISKTFFTQSVICWRPRILPELPVEVSE